MGLEDKKSNIKSEYKKLHLTFQDERLIRILHSLSHENQMKIKKYVYKIYTENKTD